MAVNRFIPEIWSARLLVALRKALVYAGPTIVNRDYEGEIREAGDTVRITSISRPTIGDYVPNSTTITPEELTDAQRTLVVDQSKFWAFKVDDVNSRQAAGNVIPQAMSEAAFALGDVVDQFVAGLYTGVQSANDLGTVAPTVESDDFYNKVLVPLKVLLDEANVPTQGRYCVVPAWAHGLLLQSKLFVAVDQSGTSEGLRNGMVGRGAGFDILMSNNTPEPTTDNHIVQGGTQMAISFAEQINKTEAYRPESSFSDAVKGLALYGAKLLRPDAIAIATVTRPAGI